MPAIFVWFLWPMFSFQVYPGNLLNTYHWRAVDADRVVVWRGWYTSAVSTATKPSAAWPARTAPPRWKRTSSGRIVQRGLKSRGYVPGPLVSTRLRREFGAFDHAPAALDAGGAISEKCADASARH
jgi:hypothetical protein